MKSLKDMYWKTTLALFGILSSGAGFAEESDLIGVSGRAGENVSALSGLFEIAFYVAGVGFAGLGLIKVITKQQGEPVGKYLTFIVVGSLLLAFPTLMNIIVGSTTGGTTGFDLIEAG